ncbi:MAG: ribonuclease P protein component [Sphingobacteriaceae bacterium]|nr:ribonuclease P protein component [Sphingobacteriaceae bacterium]
MEYLFKKGKSKIIAPIRVTYVITEIAQEHPAKAMFIVPKRLFKKAKDRNKLKRRIKEAYRKNKFQLYEKLNGAGKKYLIGFSYTAKEISSYEEIEKSVLKLIEKII